MAKTNSSRNTRRVVRSKTSRKPCNVRTKASKLNESRRLQKDIESRRIASATNDLRRISKRQDAYLAAVKENDSSYQAWARLRSYPADLALCEAVFAVYEARTYEAEDRAVRKLRAMVTECDTRAFLLCRAGEVFSGLFRWTPLPKDLCFRVARDWINDPDADERWAIGDDVYNQIAAKATVSAFKLSRLLKGKREASVLLAGIVEELGRQNDLGTIAVLVLAHFTR